MYELRVVYKEGLGSPMTLELPMSEYRDETSLQRYTAGALARGDTITCTDVKGETHNIPAANVLRCSVSTKNKNEHKPVRKQFVEDGD